MINQAMEYHEFFGSNRLTPTENRYLRVEEVILLHNLREYQPRNIERKL